MGTKTWILIFALCVVSFVAGPILLMEGYKGAGLACLGVLAVLRLTIAFWDDGHYLSDSDHHGQLSDPYEIGRSQDRVEMERGAWAALDLHGQEENSRYR